jgi:hypothetical protein
VPGGAGLEAQRFEASCFALPALTRDAFIQHGAERAEELFGRLDEDTLRLLVGTTALLHRVGGTWGAVDLPPLPLRRSATVFARYLRGFDRCACARDYGWDRRLRRARYGSGGGDHRGPRRARDRPAISDEELAVRHVTRLRGAVADPAEMAALSARSLARRGRRVAPGDRTGGTARRGGRSSSCNRGSRDAWEDAARDRATVAARAGMTSKDDCGHRRDRKTAPATSNQPRQAGGALT